MPDPKRCNWPTCERTMNGSFDRVALFCRFHRLMEGLNALEGWVSIAKNELSQLIREDDEQRRERRCL